MKIEENRERKLWKYDPSVSTRLCKCVPTTVSFSHELALSDNNSPNTCIDFQRCLKNTILSQFVLSVF